MGGTRRGTLSHRIVGSGHLPWPIEEPIWPEPRSRTSPATSAPFAESVRKLADPKKKLVRVSLQF
jgi:hypothetical protein